MRQLPIFVQAAGRPIMLLGTGEAADAKRRLIERAGGVCVGEDDDGARIAFVALEDEDEAVGTVARLKARGLLVNAVDRPALCDFTTPAIVDRDPLTLAIGTGGASAGTAKAVRLRLEALLPPTLGALAQALADARPAMAERWPDKAARRRAIDAALLPGGALDPLVAHGPDAIAEWIAMPDTAQLVGLVVIDIHGSDPDDLTLRTVRLLGQVDTLYHDAAIAPAILSRARADAAIAPGPPPMQGNNLGLTVYLRVSPCPRGTP